MPHAADFATGPKPVDSDLLGGLLSAALLAFDRDQAVARRYIEQAHAVAQGSPMERPSKGLLADWQTRRAERYINENIRSSLRIDDVAKIINLSGSYFSRAFKVTKGMSYTSYVIRARINLAKKLLLTTDAPISEIALDCGLADQSHLTRLFSHTVGLPPKAWRRQQAERLDLAS